jgi:hypothetical protein
MSINIGRQVNLIGFHRNGSIGSLSRACQEPKSASRQARGRGGLGSDAVNTIDEIGILIVIVLIVWWLARRR